MKRVLAVLLTALIVLAAMPAFAVLPQATQARTTLLDLSNTTTAASSSAEGWSFAPRGYNNKPQLTLNSYGKANQHSAPIIVPKDTRIVVNGDCYIDNVYMGEAHPALSGSPDGYLIIDGSGTLNLYTESYHGCCLTLPNGGENVEAEFLYINDVTINCYGMERDMYNCALKLQPCIYSNHNIEIHNATINTHWGKFGIRVEGYTPIGGTSETNCNEILIDNSTVNIQNESDNGLWNYAYGLNITYGKIHITGNSNVTINAGSQSIYAYHSLTIDGGTVNILSTPVSTADIAALVYCKWLVLGQGLQSFYVSTTKYPLTKVLHCKQSGMSSLGSGLNMQIGTFSGGDFTPGEDPNNGDLPALYVTGGGTVMHTVRFYGYGDQLLSTVQVPHGGTATPPSVQQVINNSNGTYLFYQWDRPLNNVTSNMDVHAEYVLIGDTSLNDVVQADDALLALRSSMGIDRLSDKMVFAGDIDRNGSLEASDALLILRYVMGIIDTLYIP